MSPLQEFTIENDLLTCFGGLTWEPCVFSMTFNPERNFEEIKSLRTYALHSTFIYIPTHALAKTTAKKQKVLLYIICDSNPYWATFDYTNKFSTIYKENINIQEINAPMATEYWNHKILYFSQTSEFMLISRLGDGCKMFIIVFKNNFNIDYKGYVDISLENVHCPYIKSFCIYYNNNNKNYTILADSGSRMSFFKNTNEDFISLDIDNPYTSSDQLEEDELENNIPTTILTTEINIPTTMVTTYIDIPTTILTTEINNPTTIFTTYMYTPTTIITTENNIPTTIITTEINIPTSIFTTYIDIPNIIITTEINIHTAIITTYIDTRNTITTTYFEINNLTIILTTYIETIIPTTVITSHIEIDSPTTIPIKDKKCKNSTEESTLYIFCTSKCPEEYNNLIINEKLCSKDEIYNNEYNNYIIYENNYIMIIIDDFIKNIDCYNLCDYYYFDSNKKYYCSNSEKFQEQYTLIKQERCFEEYLNDLEYKYKYEYTCHNSCPYNNTLYEDNYYICKIKSYDTENDKNKIENDDIIEKIQEYILNESPHIMFKRIENADLIRKYKDMIISITTTENQKKI